MDEFHAADATPYRVLPWLFIVPEFAVFVVAGVVAVRKPTSSGGGGNTRRHLSAEAR